MQTMGISGHTLSVNLSLHYRDDREEENGSGVWHWNNWQTGIVLNL